MRRVAILGGGIAGLTAACRLAKREGVAVTLLEATSRLGGSILTVREEGFVAEGGPNTLRTTGSADRLLEELGLAATAVHADPKAPRWIVRGGRARAIAPGPAALFTAALPWNAKLRVLREPWVAKRPAALEDESVHDFFARRFGPDVARYAAGPIVSGVYADDPRTLSVRSAFPALWAAEERGGSVIRGFLKRPKPAPGETPKPRHRSKTLNFDGGLATLVEKLAERIVSSGGAIELGDAAVALEGPRPAAPAWTVTTRAGRRLEADVVVSTLDAPAAARLLGPRLPRSGERIAAIASSAVSVVLQGWEVPRPDAAPRGFGVLIPRGEGLRALGVLYPSSLFSGRAPAGKAATTTFLGGALEPELAAASDNDLLTLGEYEVRHLHPHLGRRVFSRVVRWPQAIPRLPLGHHRTLALLEEDLAEVNRGETTLVVTGGWRDGVALGQRIERAEAAAELVTEARPQR